MPLFVQPHRQIQPVMLGGVQGAGARAETQGPKGRERGVVFMGRGSQLGGMGNVVSSPSGIRGRAAAAKKFSCILQAPDGLSWNLLCAKFGGGHGPAHPP